MKFQNFHNFAFNLEMLKQPLVITDQTGQTTNVEEPIVNQSNPNVNITTTTGGELTTGSLIWVSKNNQVQKGTQVKLANGDVYIVDGAGTDVTAGLTYYALQANNERSREDDVDDF